MLNFSQIVSDVNVRTSKIFVFDSKKYYLNDFIEINFFI